MQSEYSEIERVEEALDAGLASVNTRLSRLQTAVHQAMAELVCSSTAYQNLIAQHRRLWASLRTTRAMLAAVNAGLGGAVPQSALDEAQRTEPLLPSRDFPIDQGLVAAWADALAALKRFPVVEFADYERRLGNLCKSGSPTI